MRRHATPTIPLHLVSVVLTSNSHKIPNKALPKQPPSPPPQQQQPHPKFPFTLSFSLPCSQTFQQATTSPITPGRFRPPSPLTHSLSYSPSPGAANHAILIFIITRGTRSRLELALCIFIYSFIRLRIHLISQTQSFLPFLLFLPFGGNDGNGRMEGWMEVERVAAGWHVGEKSRCFGTGFMWR